MPGYITIHNYLHSAFQNKLLAFPGHIFPLTSTHSKRFFFLFEPKKEICKKNR